MRTNLSCCLRLIDNGQYKSTNRLLVVVPHERSHEGSVPCPGQPELAYKGKSSALVTGFVLAEGTHQTRYLFGELHSI